MAAAARQPTRRAAKRLELKPLEAPRPRSALWVGVLLRGGRYAFLVALLLSCLIVHALTVLEGERLSRFHQQRAVLATRAQALRAEIEGRLSRLAVGTSSRAAPPTLLSVQPAFHPRSMPKAPSGKPLTAAAGWGRESP